MVSASEIRGNKCAYVRACRDDESCHSWALCEHELRDNDTSYQHSPCTRRRRLDLCRDLPAPLISNVSRVNEDDVPAWRDSGVREHELQPERDVQEVEGIGPRDDSAPVAVTRLYHSASCASIGALCRLIPGHKRQLAHSQPIINSVCTPGRHAHMAECKHPGSAPLMESTGASLSMGINRDAAAKITPNHWSFPLLRP